MALVGATVRHVLILAALLLTACAPWQPGPDRPSRAESSPDKRVIQTPPAWYRVERGDTLYSIAFRYGLDWRELASWNDVGPPYTIRPGQELRMSAPRPVPPKSASSDAPRPDPPPSDNPPERPGPKPAPAVAEPASGASAAPSASGSTRTVGGVAWQWPTSGRLARSFDPSDTRKGIGLAGTAGQDVLAAAAGQVVYSGTALIGYGELIIIKHSDKLLSAYGHNRRRLVGEGDRVQRGQKIAEMGRDDRQEEMLHFEIRRDGEPVNPLDYLPSK